MANKVNGLEEKLVDREKEKRRLEAAVLGAREAVKILSRESVDAERALAAAAAGGYKSFLDRREFRKRDRVAAEVKARLLVAQKDLGVREEALGRIEDEIAELRVELAEPRIRAIRKRAVELTVRVKELQRELLGAAEELVGLHRATEEILPRRIVGKRSDRFLKVNLTDPALVALHTRTVHPETMAIGGSAPSIHVEFFKALAGQVAGKWKVADGEELDVGEVEILYGDPALPDEIEAIRDLDIGRLYAVNGDGGVFAGKELNFQTLEHLTSRKNIHAAQGARKGA